MSSFANNIQWQPCFFIVLTGCFWKYYKVPNPSSILRLNFNSSLEESSNLPGKYPTLIVLRVRFSSFIYINSFDINHSITQSLDKQRTGLPRYNCHPCFWFSSFYWYSVNPRKVVGVGGRYDSYPLAALSRLTPHLTLG